MLNARPNFKQRYILARIKIWKRSYLRSGKIDTSVYLLYPVGIWRPFIHIFPNLEHTFPIIVESVPQNGFWLLHRSILCCYLKQGQNRNTIHSKQFAKWWMQSWVCKSRSILTSQRNVSKKMGDICLKGNETDKEKVQDRIWPLILPCSHLYLHQKDCIVE